MFWKINSQPDGDTIKKRDGIHWRMPTAMAVCWIIGLGLALGHHFYYFSLNGTVVPGQTQQEWSLRVGTGLAFLTKTFLTTAVGIACVQNLWWILRLKPVRMSTLDSMWNIRGNIFNFFDLHIWRRGPNVALLGLISWCIPLVTVFTPSTLSVQPAVGTVVQQQQMPAIDFEFSKWYTMDDGGPMGPTPSLSRFMTGAVLQGSILNAPAPAPNSSYSLAFFGPLIQCSNSSANVSQQVYDFAVKVSAPYLTFLGFTPSSDNISYAMYQRYYRDAGFQGFDDGDENAEIVDKLVMTVWPYHDDRWVIECGIYNASYEVNFNFTNGIQSTEITDLEVHDRVLNHEQHVMPAPPNEDQLFAYTAMMRVLRDLLEGRCNSNPSTCVFTQVYSTALVNSKQIWELVNYSSNASYGDSLPSILDVASELGRNITLSLFGNPYFLNQSAGPMVNVTIHPNRTEYVYSQRNLLIAYGVSVFVSLLCVIAGLLTMWDNGMAFTESLTTIVRATRNPKFNELVPSDKTAGADPPLESLGKTTVLWVPSSGHDDDTVAGLKPLPAVAELEKAETTGSRSPITFSNRIWERKNYRQTVSRVDTSPEGFI
ncbi:hypothetical protein BJX76DRAFT_95580 [Aspergillus varians]